MQLYVNELYYGRNSLFIIYIGAARFAVSIQRIHKALEWTVITGIAKQSPDWVLCDSMWAAAAAEIQAPGLLPAHPGTR
jgi:hypothetical protein